MNEAMKDLHAVDLILGQHGILHKIGQHHHSLLHGVYKQTHPADQNKLRLPRLELPPLPQPPEAVTEQSASDEELFQFWTQALE